MSGMDTSNSVNQTRVEITQWDSGGTTTRYIRPETTTSSANSPASLNSSAPAAVTESTGGGYIAQGYEAYAAPGETYSRIKGEDGQVIHLYSSVDAEGKPVVLQCVGFKDGVRIDVPVPSTFMDRNFEGLDSISTAEVPFLLDESGAPVLGTFIVAPNEEGVPTLYGNVPDADLSSLEGWVNLGPAAASGFDNVLVGVPITITQEGSNSETYELSYSNTSAPFPEPLMLNDVAVIPASTGFSYSGETQEFTSADGKVFDVPVIEKFVVDEDGITRSEPVEVLAITVEEVDGKNMMYVITGDPAKPEAYAVGETDVAPGTYSSSAATTTTGESSERMNKYTGIHGNGNVNSDVDRKGVTLFDETNRGTATNPYDQGKKQDDAIITQLLDSNGEPIEYFISGGEEGRKGDKLHLPGVADDWDLPDNESDTVVVDGETYRVAKHKDTGTLVYYKDYEDVAYFNLETRPTSFSAPVNPEISSSDNSMYSDSIVMDANYTGSNEDSIKVPTGSTVHINQLLDSNGEPITYHVNLNTRADYVLPGSASEWKVIEGDGNSSIAVHKETGAKIVFNNNFRLALGEDKSNYVSYVDYSKM